MEKEQEERQTKILKEYSQSQTPTGDIVTYPNTTYKS